MALTVGTSGAAGVESAVGAPRGPVPEEVTLSSWGAGREVSRGPSENCSKAIGAGGQVAEGLGSEREGGLQAAMFRNLTH